MNPKTHIEISRSGPQALFEWGKACHLLNQFRRHRDWLAAFNHVIASRRDQLFVQTDCGQWVLPDENARALIDLADEEFIDRIIRAEVTA